MHSLPFRTAFQQNLQTQSASVGGFNGSQLAKMKKSIPDMSPPWNL